MQRFRSAVVLSWSLAAAFATPAFTQPASSPTPVFEVGLDGGVAGPGGFSDDARLFLAPRITVNATSRTAVSIAGDLFTPKVYLDEAWTDTHVVLAELRSGLWQTGSASVTGIVGGGFARRRSFQPESVVAGRLGPIIVPASTHTTRGGELTLGIGFEQRLAARLALRQEIRAVLGEISEFRAQAGFAVPIGRYPVRFEAPRTRSGGRPDSLANGITIGAAIGAAAMIGFVGFLAHALCEGDCEGFGSAVLVGAGYGGAAGALVGAIADSYRE